MTKCFFFTTLSNDHVLNKLGQYRVNHCQHLLIFISLGYLTVHSKMYEKIKLSNLIFWIDSCPVNYEVNREALTNDLHRKTWKSWKGLYAYPTIFLFRIYSFSFMRLLSEKNNKRSYNWVTCCYFLLFLVQLRIYS